MKLEEALFTANPNPMWIFDTQTLRILDVNKAALVFYGYTRAEMLDLTIKDLRPSEEVPKLLDEINQSGTSLNKAGTWIHKKKNGSLCYIDITSHPIDYQGNSAKLVTGHDVTDLVKARKQAEQEQAFSQTLTNALPGIYYLITQEKEFMDWNSKLEEVTGYKTEEIRHLTPYEFLATDDRDLAREKIAKVFNTGYASMEASILTKSGEQIPYLFSAKRIGIDNQHCLVGLGIDISFKHDLRLKAEQQYKLFESIIDQTEAVVYIKAEDGTFRFVNNRFASLMDLERYDLIGLRDEDILPKEEVDQITKHDQLVRMSGKPMKFRERVTIQGHTSEYMTLKVPLKDVPGYENAIAGISTDITDLKRAEEKAKNRAKQQALVAELGIYAMEEFNIQELFDRITREVADTLDIEYCKVLELSEDGEELLLRSGVGWEEGLVGNKHVKAKEQSQAGFTLVTQEPVIVENLELESRFEGPDLLKNHDVVSGMSTIIHGSKQPYGILGAHTSSHRTFTEDDVHFLQSIANLLAVAIERINAQQKYQNLNQELEQRVQKRTQQLKEANQELESFSYSVSHDLRAPLRAIQGYANLLEEDYASELSEEPTEFLEIIKDESKRMGQLIDDLLAFSRMNRSNKSIQKVDMNELVDHALEEVVQDYQYKEYNLDVESLPTAKADYNLFKQVWINLLSNAFKYCESDKTPQITISGHEQENHLQYQIEDKGVGFDPNYKDKMFGVFERLHSSTDFEGTGIGLALVYRVVKRHGGDIWADSTPGEGSIFTFTLPKHKDTDRDDE